MVWVGGLPVAAPLAARSRMSRQRPRCGLKAMKACSHWQCWQFSFAAPPEHTEDGDVRLTLMSMLCTNLLPSTGLVICCFTDLAVLWRSAAGVSYMFLFALACFPDAKRDLSIDNETKAAIVHGAAEACGLGRIAGAFTSHCGRNGFAPPAFAKHNAGLLASRGRLKY